MINALAMPPTGTNSPDPLAILRPDQLTAPDQQASSSMASGSIGQPQSSVPERLIAGTKGVSYTFAADPLSSAERRAAVEIARNDVLTEADATRWMLLHRVDLTGTRGVMSRGNKHMDTGLSNGARTLQQTLSSLSERVPVLEGRIERNVFDIGARLELHQTHRELDTHRGKIDKFLDSYHAFLFYERPVVPTRGN